jgi:ABC-type sugar transport system ATPase subunit
MTEVLRTSDLAVRRGDRAVLTDVNLNVSAREIVAVLGPNGAGKSTLLAALAGSLAPAVGTVTRNGRLAMLMQTPGLASRSVRANVELALAWSGVPRRDRRRRAHAALDRMQAGHLAKRRAHTLSGGEQRRVHLARAVGIGADVLLLDEPFDGLDPGTHVALRQDTADALRNADGAALVVLHERADAWAMADRIVVLIDGRVLADGAPQAILDKPPAADVARFLGYDGELSTEGGILLTRANHVCFDDYGDLDAVVERVVGIEDGQRVHLRTPRGSVWAHDWEFAARVGDTVRIRIDGGAEFPA